MWGVLWKRRGEHLEWFQRSKKLPTVGALASTAARLAVFLRAGLSATRAWEELARDPELDDPTRELADEIHRGLERHIRHRDAVVDACATRGEPARVFAALVQVADEAGAPLHSALWSLAEALRDRLAVEAEVRAIAAAPRQTAWLLMALPPLGLLVAWALGVEVGDFFMDTALGGVSLVLAVILYVTAWAWMRRLVSQLLPDAGYLSPAHDLLAVATAGGALPETALARVQRALELSDLDLSTLPAIERLTDVSRRVGVPISVLATTEASWQRHRARAEASDAAATLSVQILIPLGLLLLPAFVIVGVVPVVVSLLQDAIASGQTGLW